MTVESRRWTVRLTAVAEVDFEETLRWTLAHFGTTQAHDYAQTLITAIAELADGPDVTGVKERKDIGNGLFTLHVARQGRRGRHFLLFRIRRDKSVQVIEVLRLLHDAMDLPRHLPVQE